MPKPDYTSKGFFGLDQASVGPVGAWVNELPQYARRIESRTVGNITTIYKGWALYGAAEADSVWMIQRIVIDESVDLDLTDGLAGGEAGEFGFSWTGRAGHSYS